MKKLSLEKSLVNSPPLPRRVVRGNGTGYDSAIPDVATKGILMSQSIPDALQEGFSSTEEALEFYDALEPVAIEAMVGTWRGAELPSDHPMDGLLTAAGWYGKRFLDAENALPLLFYTAGRTEAFAVDPGKIPSPLLHLDALPLRPQPGLHWMVLAARPVMQTHHPKARLRMLEYRGQVSAAMIYDDLPIIDVFRRVDDHTLVGLMDMRGMARPYFFVLRRDDRTPVV